MCVEYFGAEADVEQDDETYNPIEAEDEPKHIHGEKPDKG